MKKSVYRIGFFALMCFALMLFPLLFAAPVWAADDGNVKGLWVEIPGLPEAGSTSFNAQPGGEGEAYFERIMDDGALVVSVERIDAENRNGDTWGPGDAAKLAVRLENIREEIEVAEDDIDVTEQEEELAEIYSYPVATARYMTGGEEEMRGNQDIFIFTDDWVFRVHLSISVDHLDDYDSDKVEGWFENMKIVERDSSETGEAKDGGQGDENSGEAQSKGGQVIELTADDADLSEAPDANVKGLWLRCPGFPKDAEALEFMDNEEFGEVQYTRGIDNGALQFMIRRQTIEDSELRTPDDVKDLLEMIVNNGDGDVDSIRVDTEAGAFAELFSYPCAMTEYEVEEDGETRSYATLFIFTDQYCFLVQASIPKDSAADYQPRFIEWLKELEFVGGD
ncbi:MAG: hypothetical protein LBI74_04620 [Synergistaceae bacterium]|nr:hypothetical protein [Synergistaceae bacterium]